MGLKTSLEFELINNIRRNNKIYSRDVLKAIGDDAAVVCNSKDCMLLTTDTLVQGVHFQLRYSTPRQIGMKAVEQSVSDIASMGGVPKYALISLGIPKKISLSFAKGFYNGINEKSKKYKISVTGGNITRSKEIFASIFLVGYADKKNIALRSGAKVGDFIFCSGDAGKSAAGLGLLNANKKGNSIKNHLEPRARLDLARNLMKIGINSMIDVSDGIASEVRHICDESDVGAVIYSDKIPIARNTIVDAIKIKKNPIELALHGGEDFELIFTASKGKLRQLKKYDVSVIGEIVKKKYGIKLMKNNKEYDLGGGFDHFKS